MFDDLLVNAEGVLESIQEEEMVARDQLMVANDTAMELVKDAKRISSV